MDIETLIVAIQAGRIRISDHADEEAAADQVTLDDILYSVSHGELIEDYQIDNPYPSCLVYGTTPDDLPVHSVWAYNEINGWCVLITVYRPDPDLWIDWRQRRNES